MTGRMRISMFVSALAFTAGCSSGSTGSGAASGDGGSSADGGGVTAIVNGCTVAAGNFTPATTITFTPDVYTPPCATAPVGATITFNGDFNSHPLMPGVAPKTLNTVPAAEMPAANPIAMTSAGTTAAFKFSKAGVYPYYCEQHYGLGMTGAIWIQ